MVMPDYPPYHTVHSIDLRDNTDYNSDTLWLNGLTIPETIEKVRRVLDQLPEGAIAGKFVMKYQWEYDWNDVTQEFVYYMPMSQEEISKERARQDKLREDARRRAEKRKEAAAKRALTQKEKDLKTLKKLAKKYPEALNEQVESE